MAATVSEVVSLQRDVGSGVPTIREKTAGGAFIAQFYGGIENILKHIHRYHGIPLPTGDLWHIEIFQRFCSTNPPPFPLLFDDRLSTTLAPYRKFRHVVHHGYGRDAFAAVADSMSNSYKMTNNPRLAAGAVALPD